MIKAFAHPSSSTERLWQGQERKYYIGVLLPDLKQESAGRVRGNSKIRTERRGHPVWRDCAVFFQDNLSPCAKVGHGWAAEHLLDRTALCAGEEGRVAQSCGTFREGKTCIKMFCTCRYIYLFFHSVASVVQNYKIMEWKQARLLWKKHWFRHRLVFRKKMCLMCEVKWRWVKKSALRCERCQHWGW